MARGYQHEISPERVARIKRDVEAQRAARSAVLDRPQSSLLLWIIQRIREWFYWPR